MSGNENLLAALESLEKNRGIDRQELKRVVEESVVQGARRVIGPVNELRVNLDLISGEIRVMATLTVVERVRQPETEIELEKVAETYPHASIGDEVDWEVTPANFGRIAAQNAMQGIKQRLRQAEKSKVVGDYEDKIGDIIFGTVSRYERGDVVVNLDRTEGILRHNDRVPREDYQIGDHVCCVLTEVNTERPGPILSVSRSSPMLVQRLFEREVAEIGDNIVESKSVARVPGYRAKIAVHSHDPKVDPVGACVGVRGTRVKNIVRELNGEKVDIVRWDPDIAVFVANAMKPAELRDVQVDEEERTLKVTVNEDQLSLAIGRKGQNIRLTTRLTEWNVQIQKTEEITERRVEERLQHYADSLARSLSIPLEQADILVHNGILTVDGVTSADEADIAECLDEAAAQQIKEAARAAADHD